MNVFPFSSLPQKGSYQSWTVSVFSFHCNRALQLKWTLLWSRNEFYRFGSIRLLLWMPHHSEMAFQKSEISKCFLDPTTIQIHEAHLSTGSTQGAIDTASTRFHWKLDFLSEQRMTHHSFHPIWRVLAPTHILQSRNIFSSGHIQSYFFSNALGFLECESGTKQASFWIRMRAPILTNAQQEKIACHFDALSSTLEEGPFRLPSVFSFQWVSAPNSHRLQFLSFPWTKKNISRQSFYGWEFHFQNKHTCLSGQLHIDYPNSFGWAEEDPQGTMIYYTHCFSSSLSLQFTDGKTKHCLEAKQSVFLEIRSRSKNPYVSI